MYHLFEVTGIELEYMIVDRDTLQIRPIADKIILPKSDNKSDVLNGDVDWSNELVSHVMEIKTHAPTKSLLGWDKKFHANIREINQLLKAENSMLLPTGTHPFMDPHKETVIWPHEFNEIYALYDSIFNCQGHGWSNVQSMHINLPFYGDEEFARLHAAIRIVLPLIPSLCASTPIVDGKTTGFADTRLEYYRHNQKKIPSIAGKIIPERAFSKREYYQQIFDLIIGDIKPYDKDGILDHHFLNSRGAISRFDRGAIEIRLIDLQESPKADLAIAGFFIQLIKLLTEEKWSPLAYQQSAHEDSLFHTLLDGIKYGDKQTIKNKYILKSFGINSIFVPAKEFWETMLKEIEPEDSVGEVIEHIVQHGNLSSRVLKSLDTSASSKSIADTYKKLGHCLEENELFA